MNNSARAFIFDMDDLLVRSGPIWRAAETHLLRRLGHEWNPDLAATYKGMNALDVAAAIHGAFEPAIPLTQCRKILRNALIDGFAGPIEAMPGAVGLVRRLHGSAPLALASGSPLGAIAAALDRLDIRHCFDRLISSESVARGKPFPDVFLAAADALDVRPVDCLVFEDSLVGVKAARAAGMRCFAVPSGAQQEIRRLATRVFDSLAEIRINELLRPPSP